MKLADLQLLPDDSRPAALRDWVPVQDEVLGAAALALGTGLPDLARRWAQSAGPAGAALEAAAALRLGQLQEALELIGPLPGDARRAVLLARAHWLGGDPDSCWAEAARSQARQEGDAPALVAAVTVLGEVQLSDARAALRTLAEGLKVAEMTGEAADAHLLAVLAYVQRFVGSGAMGSEVKAHRTAHKALERSAPRSPARVWALLALGREVEARAEAEAGQLAAGWWPRH
ncbi:hypothetical protein GCM10022631_31090 [Deinococcus rubellus]|uniref:Tetratricopeptide repeat protein n=1 Tax=Deinococcus rubellus TaxID=1889240 RepID=A0ABY5YFG8_9DEIO|nr:hypothetical protein [Deinococcus rubellus]UWX63451.1 hypothetical protein N0D28_11945 [Deinococcus rubellus]